ncbi:hypothetical protein B2A_14644, partial [mine drainage metagenome]
LSVRLLEWEKTPPESHTRPSPVRKHGVYESPFDFFFWDDPDVQSLARFCLNHLGHLIQVLNGYSAEEMAELRLHHHSWFHITRPGGYTSLHNHAMASWSGVYCVDPGQPAHDATLSGTLRLFDPRSHVSMFLDPANSYLIQPYGFGAVEHHFRPGELVLFPSYLYHEVSPYEGTDVRLTVAFNVWVRYEGEPKLEPGFHRGARHAQRSP